MLFPSHDFHGKVRYWTKERVTRALAMVADEIDGPLPCLDEEYSRLKKGHLEWPSTGRILEYYHSMARAWLAAGISMDRVTMHNQMWTPDEDEYLLQHAGRKTFEQMAKHLGRTRSAVKERLNRYHNTHARHNQGFYSAAELAKEYKCSCHRIRIALREGKIKGQYNDRLHRWEIDILDVWASPQALIILNRPKRTWKNGETDLGDYYRRHGLKRTMMEGRMVAVPAMTVSR